MRYQQFNIQQLYVLLTLYLCVLNYLRTNSDLYHLQHKLIGFYNRDEKCLPRGTNWVFKYSDLRFVFKGLNYTNKMHSIYSLHRRINIVHLVGVVKEQSDDIRVQGTEYCKVSN